MRSALLAAVLLVVSTAVVAAPQGATPRQARVYHRNAQDCADGKLEPLFMADWWYDLNAAMAEHRIDETRQQLIEKQMMVLVTDLARQNKSNDPAIVIAYCQKLNLLRPHWSQW